MAITSLMLSELSGRNVGLSHLPAPSRSRTPADHCRPRRAGSAAGPRPGRPRVRTRFHHSSSRRTSPAWRAASPRRPWPARPGRDSGSTSRSRSPGSGRGGAGPACLRRATGRGSRARRQCYSRTGGDPDSEAHSAAIASPRSLMSANWRRISWTNAPAPVRRQDGDERHPGGRGHRAGQARAGGCRCRSPDRRAPSKATRLRSNSKCDVFRAAFVLGQRPSVEGVLVHGVKGVEVVRAHRPDRVRIVGCHRPSYLAAPPRRTHLGRLTAHRLQCGHHGCRAPLWPLAARARRAARSAAARGQLSRQFITRNRRLAFLAVGHGGDRHRGGRGARVRVVVLARRDDLADPGRRPAAVAAGAAHLLRGGRGGRDLRRG